MLYFSYLILIILNSLPTFHLFKKFLISFRYDHISLSIFIQFFRPLFDPSFFSFSISISISFFYSDTLSFCLYLLFFSLFFPFLTMVISFLLYYLIYIYIEYALKRIASDDSLTVDGDTPATVSRLSHERNFTGSSR